MSDHGIDGKRGDEGASRKSPARDARPGTHRLRIGVSSCLLGERVRWNAGHKRFPFLADELAPFVQWVPICPEVEIGLGVPREAIRLERSPAPEDRLGETGAMRLRAVDSGRDLTEVMGRWAAERVRLLASEDLHGYVMKSRSPSCGKGDVDLFDPDGRRLSSRGTGVFAAALEAGCPRLPTVREADLSAPAEREHFVERAVTRRRLDRFRGSGPGPADFVAFVETHELQWTLHSSEGRKTALRLASDVVRTQDMTGSIEELDRVVTATVAIPPTLERHLGVLRRARTRLTRFLPPERVEAIDSGIASFAERGSGRAEALESIRSATRDAGDPVLLGQTWLWPEPVELAVIA